MATGMAIVDFTNPAATKWYLSKLRALLDMGVDCFKTDFGERIPHVNIKFHDGSDPMRMHNWYSVLYISQVHKLLEEVKGKAEAVLFARSGAAGGQRFPVVRAVPRKCSKQTLKPSLPAALGRRSRVNI
jgi:alpha-glucosidase (family GH31 glycosyl hydrolase)